MPIKFFLKVRVWLHNPLIWLLLGVDGRVFLVNRGTFSGIRPPNCRVVEVQAQFTQRSDAVRFRKLVAS